MVVVSSMLGHHEVRSIDRGSRIAEYDFANKPGAEARDSIVYVLSPCKPIYGAHVGSM